MCKAHSKVTHIKQQKYFHHLKSRGYNYEHLYSPRMVEEIKEEEKLEHQTNKQ